MSRAVILLLALLLTPAPAAAQEMVLSVAVSMKEAVEELGRGFRGGRAGVTLRYNFGGSGELHEADRSGAPIDLFISAAQRQMDELEKEKLIVPESRRVSRATCSVIKPPRLGIRSHQAADLLDARVGRIVIGNPQTVPVAIRRGEPADARLWRGACSRSSSSPRTCVRPSTTSPATRSTPARLHDRRRGVARAGEGGVPPRRERTYRPVYPAAVVGASRRPALAQALHRPARRPVTARACSRHWLPAAAAGGPVSPELSWSARALDPRRAGRHRANALIGIPLAYAARAAAFPGPRSSICS